MNIISFGLIERLDRRHKQTPTICPYSGKDISNLHEQLTESC